MAKKVWPLTKVFIIYLVATYHAADAYEASTHLARSKQAAAGEDTYSKGSESEHASLIQGNTKVCNAPQGCSADSDLVNMLQGTMYTDSLDAIQAGEVQIDQVDDVQTDASFGQDVVEADEVGETEAVGEDKAEGRRRKAKAKASKTEAKAACNSQQCYDWVAQCKDAQQFMAWAEIGCEAFAYGYPEGARLPFAASHTSGPMPVSPNSYECCSLDQCYGLCENGLGGAVRQRACKKGCDWMEQHSSGSCCKCTNKAVDFRTMDVGTAQSSEAEVWNNSRWELLPNTCTDRGATCRENVCTEGFLYIKVGADSWRFSGTVNGQEIPIGFRENRMSRFSIVTKTFTECMAEKDCYDQIKADVPSGEADTFIKDCLLCDPDDKSNTLCSKYRTCIRRNRATLSDKSNLLLKNIDIATEQIKTATAVLTQAAAVSGSGGTCTDPLDNAIVKKLKSNCGCLQELHDACDGAEDQQVCLKQFACKDPQVCKSWKRATKGGQKNCPSSFVEQASDSNLSSATSALDETLMTKKTCR